MPYFIKQLAPDLLHIEMSGHVDQETAKVYYPQACEILDACPKPVHIVMDARSVQSVCPVARDTVDKVRYHPNVGVIAFVVKQRYLLIFSPVVQFFGGIRMFGDERSAIEFLKQRSSYASQVFLPVVEDEIAVKGGAKVLLSSSESIQGAFALSSEVHGSSSVKDGSDWWRLSNLANISLPGVSVAPTPVSPAIAQFDDTNPVPRHSSSPPNMNPVAGVFSFLADMIESMTRPFDDGTRRLE